MCGTLDKWCTANEEKLMIRQRRTTNRHNACYNEDFLLNEIIPT